MTDHESSKINAGSYVIFLNQVKADIQQSQLRAALSVTRELTNLYWRIGRGLSAKVSEEGWGAKTIERFAKDINSLFPDVSGFSFRNIKYMRQFAENYPNENWAATVAQIPWGHNIVLKEPVGSAREE